MMIGSDLHHLTEHDYKHFLSPLCDCSQNVKSATQFFLFCPSFFNEIHSHQEHSLILTFCF